MADYRDDYNDRTGRSYGGSHQDAWHSAGHGSHSRGRGGDAAGATGGSRRPAAQPEYYEPINYHPSGRPKTVRQYPEDNGTRGFARTPGAGQRPQVYGGYQQQDYRADQGYDQQQGYWQAQGGYEQAAGRYYDQQPSPYAAQHIRPLRTESPSMPGSFAEAGDLLRSNPKIAIAIVAALIAIVALVVSVASCAISAANNKSLVPAVSSTSAVTPVDDQQGANVADATANQTVEVAPVEPAQPEPAAPNDVWQASIQSVDNETQYTSGGVEDPWSPTGWFTTGDAELDQLVKDYCDYNTSQDLDAGDNAYYTYLHVSWWEYVENDQNQRPWDLGDRWTIEYAKRALSTYEANCYDFAAVLMYVMRYFGYSDAVAQPCLILRQSGSWGDHGLVFLTSLDGRSCLLDASLSGNGWLLDSNIYTYQIDDGTRGYA